VLDCVFSKFRHVTNYLKHVKTSTHKGKKVATSNSSKDQKVSSEHDHSQSTAVTQTWKSVLLELQPQNPYVEPTTISSQLYPHLHEAIINELAEHRIPASFHEDNSDEGSIRDYSTFVMGRFTCDNNSCPRNAWTSKKVTLFIRKYSNDRYNAAVYDQSCKFCEELGRLAMDEKSYVDRVSYRLKRWAGVEMEPPQYNLKKTPPHVKEHCEGCKAGICGG